MNIDVTQGSEVRCIDGVGCRIDNAFERELDVIRRHLTETVGEHLAGLQAKRVVGVVDGFEVLGGLKLGVPATVSLKLQEILIYGIANQAFSARKRE